MMTPVPTIPELNKRPGVCYALTNEGVELPVIDVTNPHFCENAGPAELATLAADFRHMLKMPAFIRNFMGRRSIALRGLNARSGAYLGGMTTYVCKLGPGMLGRGYAGAIDRRVAGAIGAVAFRIRLQDMARLLADEFIPVLGARAGSPVVMLNIGGGPAMDSINALTVIRKEHPELLEGRRISIFVLDRDQAGPSFGARAITALRSDGAPLCGLEISLAPVAHDWASVPALERFLGRFGADVTAIGSSEGGLFEYGSDEAILGNLRVLRQGTPADFAIVGSTMRDDDIPRWIQSTSKFSLHIFKSGEFRNLVESAGWTIGRATELNPIQRVISLHKSLPV